MLQLVGRADVVLLAPVCVARAGASSAARGGERRHEQRSSNADLRDEIHDVAVFTSARQGKVDLLPGKFGVGEGGIAPVVDVVEGYLQVLGYHVVIRGT
jgi:hypothetical protein